LNFIEHVHQFVTDYGYIAVFLGIFFEDFGLPTPGETMLIAGAVLASHGSLNIYWLLPIAWVGAVAGDSIGFLIGAKGGNKLLTRYGNRIGITEERLQRVETLAPRVDSRLRAGDYTAALIACAGAKEAVDRFFDDVMVMADDPALRANRLALLRRVRETMNRVADIALLAA